MTDIQQKNQLDEGLVIVNAIELKTHEYYQQLCEVFAVEDILKDFCDMYQTSDYENFHVNKNNPIQQQLLAVLKLRAALTIELEELQELHTEVEDNVSFFDIQLQLEYAHANRRKLESELKTTKSKLDKVSLQNTLLNAEMLGLKNEHTAYLDSLKKQHNVELTEAKTRAKDAERAFIASTRRSPSANATNISNIPARIISVQPTAVPASISQQVISPAFIPYRSVSDKIKQNNSRFKEYSCLTALDDYDSLDEDASGDEDVPGSKSISVPTSSASDILPTVPTINLQSIPVSSESIETPMNFHETSQIEEPSPSQTPASMDCFVDLTPSRSSTPRKGFPESSESQGIVGSLQDQVSNNIHCTPIRCVRPTSSMLADDDVETVEKQEYLKLLDEVIELRGELDRVNSATPRDDSQQRLFGDLTNNSSIRINEHGLTSQLIDLHEQVCRNSQIDEFAVVATQSCESKSSAGEASLPILAENKQFADWSISLDQTNPSQCESIKIDELNSSALQHSDIAVEGQDDFDNLITPRSTQPEAWDFLPTDVRLSTELRSVPQPGIRLVLFENSDDVNNAPNTYSISVTGTDYDVVCSGTTSCMSTHWDLENCPSLSSSLGHEKQNDTYSIGMQTEDQIQCLRCSLTNSDNICQHNTANNLHSSPVDVPSPASTLQECHIDFSEIGKIHGPQGDTASQTTYRLEEKFTHNHGQSGKNTQLNFKRTDLNVLADVASVCMAMRQRLSQLHNGISDYSDSSLPSSVSVDDQGLDELIKQVEGDLTHCEFNLLSPALQQLNKEIELIVNLYTSLSKRTDEPSPISPHILQFNELQAKLDMAEKLLVEKLPIGAHDAVTQMNKIIESERNQLQMELERRMLDCGATHATCIAELERTHADLDANLRESESRSLELEAELEALSTKYNANKRFLEELLHERDQEREEFSNEIARLKELISELRSMVVTLKRDATLQLNSSTKSLSETFGKPSPSKINIGKNDVCLSVTSSDPSPQRLTEENVGVCWRHRKPSDTLDSAETLSLNSDVDDSTPYVVMTSDPRENLDEKLETAAQILQGIQLCGGYLMNECTGSVDLTRPHSAGDVFRRKRAHSSVKNLSVCVGGSPVNFVDVAVSAKSLSSHSSSGSTSASELEVDEVFETTTTTTAAAAAVSSIITTTTRRQPMQKRKTSTRRRTPPVPALEAVIRGNTVDLDYELRHVAQMDELRESLAKAQAELAERKAEIEQLLEKRDQSLRVDNFTSDSYQQSINKMRSFSESSPSRNASLNTKFPTHHKSLLSVSEDTGIDTLRLEPSNESSSVRVQAFSEKEKEEMSIGPSTDTTTTTLQPVKEELEEAISQPILSRESTMSPTHTASSDNNSLSTAAAASGITSANSMVEVDSDAPPQSNMTENQVETSADLEQALTDLEEALIVIESLRAEIDGLINYQDDLHRDFELVQTMLEERQSEVERLQQDLLVVPVKLQAEFDCSVRKLQRNMAEQCNVVEERDEDMYLLNEAKMELEARVQKLEDELESIQRSSIHVDVSEAASQTDPFSCRTADSGIQVDTSLFITDLDTETGLDKTESCSDSMNGTAELPFDGIPDDNCFKQHSILFNSAPLVENHMGTPEAVMALVEKLHHEGCRLLSLSFAMKSIAPKDGNHEQEDKKNEEDEATEESRMKPAEMEVSDFKSQALNRLIEANCLLKNALKSIIVLEPSGEIVEEENHKLTNGVQLSDPLFSALLSALVADRKASVSLLTSASIDGVSQLNLQPSRRPLSGGPSQKAIPSHTDVIKSLTAYMNAEEERWNSLSTAFATDRQTLFLELDCLRKRENSLVEQTVRLSAQLNSHKEEVAQKSLTIVSLTEKLSTLQQYVRDVQERYDRTKLENDAHDGVRNETKRVVKLEESLASINQKYNDILKQVKSLEQNLQKSSSDVLLERNRSHLAETRVLQLDDEIRHLKASFVRTSSSGHSSPFDNEPLPIRNRESSVHLGVNLASSKLASARQQAIQAEKISRELQASNQGLRMSIVEAELSLLPLAKIAENGQNHSHTFGHMPHMADSGFADAPAEIRRIYASCMLLLHLVNDEETSQLLNTSSSSEDSLNNPAELLRHAMVTRNVSTRTDISIEPILTSRLDEIAICLQLIQRQVQQAVGTPFPNTNERGDTKGLAADLIRAKKLILSGVSRLDDGLQSMEALGVDLSRAIRSAEASDKSIQCVFMSDYKSPTGGQTVSFEKIPGIDSANTNKQLFRHISAKYLRMESYRRALIYQKRYLLLMLGDFRRSEEFVTSTLGRGILLGTSSRIDFEGNPKRPDARHWTPYTKPALVRFRAAARCVQVIFRMKNLIRKWRRTSNRSLASPLSGLAQKSKSSHNGMLLSREQSAVAANYPTEKTLVHVSGRVYSRSDRSSYPDNSQLLLRQSTHNGLFDAAVGKSNNCTPINFRHHSDGTIARQLSTENLISSPYQGSPSSSKRHDFKRLL